MALNKFFRFPWARSGDKTAVPDDVVGTGQVSYDQGYGPNYELPKTNPNALDIERGKMNQVLSDVTTALQEYQTNGVPDWISNAQNGGSAYAYPIGARVRYTDGLLYISTVATNTNLPNSGTGWVRDAGRFLGRRVFTTTQTYTPTPGTAFVDVTVVGGGGGGGGSAATGAGQCAAGAGGGGGGWSRKRIAASFAGVAMTVGAGGNGGIGAAGAAGGTTSFGALVSATGGGGGSLGPAASNATTTFNGFGAAGVGSSGDVNFVGGSGFFAMYAVAPNSGQGGLSYGGMGALWVTGGYLSGNGGVGAGCGGSGSAAAASNGIATGGSGQVGVVIVEEYS